MLASVWLRSASGNCTDSRVSPIPEGCEAAMSAQAAGNKPAARAMPAMLMRVAMAMMGVRVVGMAVGQRGVRVLVGVRFPRRIGRAVRMPMMLVVLVLVRMGCGDVRVRVLVPLRQMQ